MTPPSIALVIPALDEEERLRRLLPELLERLRPTGAAGGDEIVLADGGSSDGGPALARRLGVRVVTSEPGRGTQLDAATRTVAADVVLVLHADTTLPDGAFDQVREAIAGGAEGGAFLLRFESPRRLYRLGAALINLRTRWTRLPLGDQVQFVRRDVLEAVGGFPPWPILEDLELARRLKRRGRTILLPGPVTTSARRFERRGTLRTVATNWLIWTLHACGVSPRRLARLYGRAP